MQHGQFCYEIVELLPRVSKVGEGESPRARAPARHGGRVNRCSCWRDLVTRVDSRRTRRREMKLRGSLLTCLIAVVLLAAGAQGISAADTTRYVAPGGSDTGNTCTSQAD